MVRLSLGEKQMFTMLVPGATLAVGLAWILALRWSVRISTITGVADQFVKSTEDRAPVLIAAVTGAAIALYVISLIFGATLAVIAGFVESMCFDPRQAANIGTTYEKFKRQWYRYIDQLDDSKKNSYVSHLADLFLFLMRMGFAALTLLVLVATLIHVHLLIPTVLTVLALVLLWASYKYHGELARYRERKFGVAENPMSADPRDAGA